jgi:predicted ArsR family transcriptional regulator
VKNVSEKTAGVTERDTRARVARLILEHGPITASALGERIGLTPAAIRRHLDALLTCASSPRRRGSGR